MVGGTRRGQIAPDGYALLAVLWMCVGVGALGMAVSAAARDAAAASRNRMALTEAEWRAEACLSRARSRLSAALREEAERLYRPRAPVWGRADRILAASPMGGAECEITSRAVGSRLDVNAADEGTLARLLRHVGLAAGRADSLAAAISDWKDVDDAPRTLGAERDWYEAHHRMAPSNRPFRNVQELRLVRGVDDSRGIDGVLDVEPGPVAINHAPVEVLSLLPGFTPEIAAEVAVRRGQAPLRTFTDVSDGLSPPARTAFADALPRLVAVASLEPKAWVLTARARAGRPTVTMIVELRIERAGARVGVVRPKKWIP